MVICPGIGNHSEQKYVRTFVDHSQRRGYRCAVLNHLGALPDVELTSPRMFTYGNHGNSQVQTAGGRGGGVTCRGRKENSGCRSVRQHRGDGFGEAAEADLTEPDTVCPVVPDCYRCACMWQLQSSLLYLSARVPLCQGVHGSLLPW